MTSALVYQVLIQVKTNKCATVLDLQLQRASSSHRTGKSMPTKTVGQPAKRYTLAIKASKGGTARPLDTRATKPN